MKISFQSFFVGKSGHLIKIGYCTAHSYVEFEFTNPIVANPYVRQVWKTQDSIWSSYFDAT